VLVVVLENPDRFAIRLTEQISSIGLFAVTESQCTEDEHDDEDEDDFKFEILPQEMGARKTREKTRKGMRGSERRPMSNLATRHWTRRDALLRDPAQHVQGRAKVRNAQANGKPPQLSATRRLNK
jgi:isopenicillin N synthase-like dioxygenase